MLDAVIITIFIGLFKVDTECIGNQEFGFGCTEFMKNCVFFGYKFQLEFFRGLNTHFLSIMLMVVTAAKYLIALIPKQPS